MYKHVFIIIFIAQGFKCLHFYMERRCTWGYESQRKFILAFTCRNLDKWCWAFCNIYKVTLETDHLIMGGGAEKIFEQKSLYLRNRKKIDCFTLVKKKSCLFSNLGKSKNKMFVFTPANLTYTCFVCILNT